MNMVSKLLTTTSLLLSLWNTKVTATCDSYSPAFPLPVLRPDATLIKNARDDIKNALDEALHKLKSNSTSYSVEVTSSTETLFELHHTAAVKDENRPGASHIDGESRYRIASMTKAFTVLAILQQQKAGNINLDDPINLYIPELGEKSKGGIPWKDISIRTLASQLSGIPRDMGQADLLATLQDPTQYGLPPVSKEVLPQCGDSTNNTDPCNADDLLELLDRSKPIFPPKQQSTYSNLNYELLGLALENVTGISYEEYVTEHILKVLNMTSTSFSRPNDSVSVLPKDESFFWDIELGVQNPTGGLRSSSSDMAKFARYVLTHYNGLTPALNWFNPVSYATGINSFYGTPWEIYRLDHIFPYTARPITLVTKGGGLPGYTSIMGMSPEYGFGFTILVAGEKSSLLIDIFTAIAQYMIPVVESMAQQQMSERHTGTFSAAKELGLNSSITISHSPSKGLYISSWISNSTDVTNLFQMLPRSEGEKRLQLVPTLLFKDEAKQQGEIWRALWFSEAETSADRDTDKFTVSDNSACLTDIDVASYGSLPLTEVVFWTEEDGKYQVFEPTAFRIKLDRERKQTKPSNHEEDEAAHHHAVAQQAIGARLKRALPDEPIKHFMV